MGRAKEEVRDWSKTLYALAEEEDRLVEIIKAKSFHIMKVQEEVRQLLDKQRGLRIARMHMASPFSVK